MPQKKLQEMEEIAKLISDGSDTFLKTEYISIGIFTIVFAIIIAAVVDKEAGTFYVTFAFLLGAATSIASGYIGMWISVRANVRTSKAANSSLA
jgi:K(+)-stimulated pyrophosphate-energized sodium pump